MLSRKRMLISFITNRLKIRYEKRLFCYTKNTLKYGAISFLFTPSTAAPLWAMTQCYAANLDHLLKDPKKDFRRLWGRCVLSSAYWRYIAWAIDLWRFFSLALLCRWVKTVLNPGVCDQLIWRISSTGLWAAQLFWATLRVSKNNTFKME